MLFLPGDNVLRKIFKLAAEAQMEPYDSLLAKFGQP